jgi:hypothetical protein
MIAPGMVGLCRWCDHLISQSISLSVTYTAPSQPSQLEIDDFLFLASPDTSEHLKVAITSRTARPLVVASTNLVDFGPLVADGQVNTRKIELSNNGLAAASFNINVTPNDGTVVVKPLNGHIAPAGHKDSVIPLTVEFITQRHGPMSYEISFAVEGQKDCPSVRVNAVGVAHSLVVCS